MDAAVSQFVMGQDKHRLQDDQDRTLRFMHLIRQQIDSLTSSQMDNIMVDAMQQYNMTTKLMGFPDKSKEIDKLGREVQERFAEVGELQRLLSESTDPTTIGLLRDEDEDELMQELEALGREEPLSCAEPEPAPKLPETLRQRQPGSELVAIYETGPQQEQFAALSA